MNYQLLVLFVVLSFVNVILQTVKSLLTISGSKLTSAVSNAVAYGLYTVVVIYTVCDLPLWLKIVVTMVTNFFGVYVSKWLVDKFSKDKLWKCEIAVKNAKIDLICGALELGKIPFNYVAVGEYTMFNCYCSTQKQTAFCLDLAKKCHGKISAYENKL